MVFVCCNIMCSVCKYKLNEEYKVLIYESI